MLAYIQNTTEENAVDTELKKLHVNVKRLKNNKQIGVKYMQMREWMWLTVKEEAKEMAEQMAEQKMEEMKAVMDAASQEVDAAKKEVDAYKKLLEEIETE